MAKFSCVCGYAISTSGQVPNPDEWRCLSDQDFEAFTGLINAEDLYQETKIMYRCPNSGHLWVFWWGFDEPPALYAPAELPEGWEPA
jgi:hypothetical protein